MEYQKVHYYLWMQNLSLVSVFHPTAYPQTSLGFSSWVLLLPALLCRWAKPLEGRDTHQPVNTWQLDLRSLFLKKKKILTLHDCPFYGLPHTVISGSAGFTIPLWQALEIWYTAFDGRPGFQQATQQAVEILHINLLKHKLMWSVKFLLGCCCKHWEEKDRTHFCNDLIILNTKKHGMSS